jgi:hypothetical protein
MPWRRDAVDARTTTHAVEGELLLAGLVRSEEISENRIVTESFFRRSTMAQ